METLLKLGNDEEVKVGQAKPDPSSERNSSRASSRLPLVIQTSSITKRSVNLKMHVADSGRVCLKSSKECREEVT